MQLKSNYQHLNWTLMFRKEPFCLSESAALAMLHSDVREKNIIPQKLLHMHLIRLSPTWCQIIKVQGGMLLADYNSTKWQEEKQSRHMTFKLTAHE